VSYAILKQAVQDITQNYETTFVTYIDQFIQLAERQIHMEANLPSFRKNSTGATVIGNRSITLPTDYITGKSIDITTATGVVNLLPKAAEYITEMYPLATTQAQPKFYAQYDATTLIVGPTPDLVYTVGFHYSAMPTSIVSASTTWLDTNFPQVLLYATLLHAYIFMKGSQDVMAFYKAAYDAGLAELKAVISQTDMHNYR
jgi:hypothetical protein